MIDFENTEVSGWEAAVRGMRNPRDSWGRSDSRFQGEDGDYYNLAGDTWPEATDSEPFYLGANDHDLAMRLAKAGHSESKYRRMIAVYVDITAPLYWWKEFDTYKVGTVANSCSTMHNIHTRDLTLEDFSHEHLMWLAKRKLEDTINVLNIARNTFVYGGDVLNEDGTKFTVEPNDKNIWWQMIQLLPSSYNQKRTVMLNYEVLAAIYDKRRNHKLDEWREFCRWIEGLPYSELITCVADDM